MKIVNITRDVDKSVCCSLQIDSRGPITEDNIHTAH